MPQQRSNILQQHKDSMERRTLEFDPSVFVDVKSFEATMGNMPIFTRARLEQAAMDVERVRSTKTPTGQHIIRIPHLLGSGANIFQIPDTPSPAVRVKWMNTFGLASSGGRLAPYFICEKDEDNTIIAVHTLKPDEPDHPLRRRVVRMQEPLELEEMRRLEAVLLASPFWASVRQRLDDLQVKVKNIVCVALGDLLGHDNTAEEPRLIGRYCTQHLLACTISRYLSQRYHDTSASELSSTTAPSQTSIPIIAYDPAYSVDTLHILSRLSPPITVVSDPYQYLSITPSTLVISIATPTIVPIHEIAADICFPSGPAAILCQEIQEHPWNKEGKMVQLDQWTPRVGKMLELYDATWLGSEAVDAEPEYRRDDVVYEWGQEMFWYARRE